LQTSEISEENKLPAFEIMNLGVDNRMLVNRQRKLKMYRCWMQGRFQKPATTAS
jgi:tRNAThr (cytosine32-N3)-methyltransferase